MVICKFFLTNSCSFGTQCKNEHLNVATVVKSDAEAAIKGKQWVLSTYGPFKDKPSIPNFEDQSFEEIRSLCYDAKNNGNLQALLPQLSQQTADASYKISMLCDQNHVTNNLLVNLYNDGESPGNTQTSLSTGNPFAISSGVGGGQTSLFGTNAAQQQNPFGSSIFGNKPAPSSGIFGGGSVNTGSSSSSSTANSLFGQQSAFGNTAGTGTSVFGGQNAFGGSAPANSFGTSSFGQPSASAFSLSQIAQPTDATKQSSMFGTSQFQQTQNSIFGAAPAFGNQIQPTKPSGLFGSSTSTNSMFGQSQPAPTSGLFGQSNNANQSASTGSLFSSFGAPAQPQPPQPQSIFGVANENNSIFGQSANNTAQPQPPQAQSLFGAANENNSIFGQNANSNQSMFGANQQQTANQPSSNIFANALAQQQNNPPSVFGTHQQPEQQQSIFSQSNSNTAASNIFQNQANVQPIGGSVFGGNSGLSQSVSVQATESAYSKLEDLTAEDLEWFRAGAFALGRIPTVPPPKELCV